MSIPSYIKQAIDDGRLELFEHPLAWIKKPRGFLLTPHLASQIREGRDSSAAAERQRWDSLAADIAHFVEGEYVNRNLIKQLDPKKFEHWTLRSMRPSPSIRVFARFVEPDVLLGTHSKLRGDLKGKWAGGWEHEKLVCEDHWKTVFGDRVPFTSASYKDYITYNADEKVRVD